MHDITVFFIGFSFFYGVVFLLTHFKDPFFNDQKLAQIFGIVLIVALIGLQLSHYLYLTKNNPFLFSHRYLVLLYLVAPSFYFYARSLLKAQDNFKALHLLHFLPLIVIVMLPQRWAFMLAFVVGCGYLLWLLKTIHALKQFKDQFKSEMLLLSVVFIVAVCVSLMTFFTAFDQPWFYELYASAIGIALLMVALVISHKPSISESVSEIAKKAYAVSTLTAIDCEAKIALLEELMNKDLLYQQSNLDRQTIAAELDLSTHQLSELMNTKLNMSFSSYLREQRVNAAKELLVKQPNASVLSIGLEVGFSSQSNFYDAFKNNVHTTPAKFRKQALKASQ